MDEIKCKRDGELDKRNSRCNNRRRIQVDKEASGI